MKPNQWLRAGQTVYTLMHNGWRKGTEQSRNRFWFQISADADCMSEEVETVTAAIHTAINFCHALNPADPLAAAKALPGAVAALEAILASDEVQLPIVLIEMADNALYALKGTTNAN